MVPLCAVSFLYDISPELSITRTLTKLRSSSLTPKRELTYDRLYSVTTVSVVYYIESFVECLVYMKLRRRRLCSLVELSLCGFNFSCRLLNVVYIKLQYQRGVKPSSPTLRKIFKLVTNLILNPNCRSEVGIIQ